MLSGSTNIMNKTVIIVAGGNGSRMGSELPKQFLLLKGKPLLVHTIEKFHQAFSDLKIIVVLPQNQMEYWEKLKSQYTVPQHQICTGGSSRFQSVRNGMQQINEECIVGTHDAVRPLISSANIQKIFNEAEEKGNAIPYLPCKDSIRKIENGKSFSVPREHYVLIQTPQCFKWSLIKDGYLLEEHKSFTDDASVFEFLGGNIHLVEGDAFNIKITYPEDLKYAESL